MNLPRLSINRPTAISMFFLSIVLIGIIAFRLLPVEMMPNTSFGDITINIDVRGGIPASEIEERIAKPIEEAVGTTTHLKNALSISKEGNVTVILEFEPGTNMDFAALEVREKFNRIRNKLPREIEKPIIAKYEYMDVPIMILAVTSKIRTPEDLRKIVEEKIKDRIQRIEGVARAEISGGREGKILIEIDQNKLRSYSIPINRIVDIINVNNSNLLAGEIKRAKDKYLVRTIGEFQSLSEIENLAIATTKEGSIIRIKDIADVHDSYLDPTAYARVNNQPVVSIYVQKESTANTVKISQIINKEIESLKDVLEKDIDITLTFNQAEYINKAVNRVKQALSYGAIMATLVLFLFLWNGRSVFIIASTIPFSVLFTFSLMYFSKLTLNVMTLSGLALGIGMLLDNSIVVFENIFQKSQTQIKDPPHLTNEQSNRFIDKEICIQGANEVLLPIVASTITTLVVFLPLIFINPEIKMLYSGIALTITFSLIASLLVSLSLVPMLTTKVKLHDSSQQVSTSDTEAPPPNNLSKKGIGIYNTVVSFCLHSRYIIIFLIIISFAAVLQQAKKLEKEFIGVAEQNKFTIFIELPTGTKLEVSDNIVSRVERIVSRNKDIKTFTAKVEPWSSKIYVELLPLDKRESVTSEIIETLRKQTNKIEPAFIYYEEPEEVGTKEILLEIYGYDYEVLKTLAIQIAQKIQAIPKFTDVKIRMREGRPEMHLDINKRQAALLGLSVENIAYSLHTQLRGMVATRYRGEETTPLIRLKTPSTHDRDIASFWQNDKTITDFKQLKIPSSQKKKPAQEVETIVRLDEEFRRTFEELRRISLTNDDGSQIYLSQVTDFNYDIGPSEIWRKNKSRMVQVSANTGGLALGTAANKVQGSLTDFSLPKDYFWQFGGNYDKMIRNQRELSFALILSLLLVYMILASLFESFKQPFIILFSVPLAAIGAIIALRITNKPVGTGVLIGAIMLGGIVVNNAIILIDRINFLRKKGHFYTEASGIRQSIITACADRLRPILMTSTTTVLGLLPMALDKSETSNLWAPLAITVIGGLSISTVLTLFVIPGFYLIFEDFNLRKKHY